jgi:hypothetical protein
MVITMLVRDLISCRTRYCQLFMSKKVDEDGGYEFMAICEGSPDWNTLLEHDERSSFARVESNKLKRAYCHVKERRASATRLSLHQARTFWPI